MKKAKHDWASHVATIQAQGLSTTEYAQQHGLARSTLYRWQTKLRSPTTQTLKPVDLTAPAQPSKFIALRLSEPQRLTPPAPTHCALVLSGGMRLEMPTLPAPQWLAELCCCAQGAC